MTKWRCTKGHEWDDGQLELAEGVTIISPVTNWIEFTLSASGQGMEYNPGRLCPTCLVVKIEELLVDVGRVV